MLTLGGKLLKDPHSRLSDGDFKPYSLLSFEPVTLQGGSEASSNKVAALNEIEDDAKALGVVVESDARESPVSKREGAESTSLLGLLEQVIPIAEADMNDVHDF